MTHSRIHVSDPERAIELWTKDALSFGPHGHGVIFTCTHKEADLYMRIAETSTVMPPYERIRSVTGSTLYRTSSGAILLLRPVTCLQDAATVAAEHWPFMVFHNPANWPDRRLIRLLTPRLMPTRVGQKTSLLSVISPMINLSETTETAPREIDWLAINRASSSR